MKERAYIAIDLKSFYASVECVERGLDPLTVNLVVADETRTDKTICLAVSPSLKSYGIPGRARLFEVIRQAACINGARRLRAPGGEFKGSSCLDPELKASPELALDYIVARPRMALYMEYSARIYQTYLKYVAPEDIHVYSIDEVFIDATEYLDIYGLTARALARRMILDVLETTGITAAAGIGTNLYLCKIAMDIQGKRIEPDERGVRIAELDEQSYRRLLWSHRPLTDFWRVGKGCARKLEEVGLCTMGEIARCSLGKDTDYYNEELLYRLFGVNAQLLIDHAWGWEPCTIADIKAYRPEDSSLGSGQVLPCPYPADKARLVIREMADQLALQLVEKGLVTDQLVLDVGYEGRQPRAHGSIHLSGSTSSSRELVQKAGELFDRITDSRLSVRRMSIAALHVQQEEAAGAGEIYEQLRLFTDPADEEEEKKKEEERQKERKLQEALLSLKQKYGKNTVLKGMNLLEGATARERNDQIGGHRA